MFKDWNKATQSGATEQTPPSPERTKGVFNEYHYRVQEIAELWQLSTDSVQRFFRDEPDLFLLPRSSRHVRKRRYETIRIPESVLVRVHKKRPSS
jgi:hypothetical protein